MMLVVGLEEEVKERDWIGLERDKDGMGWE